ncbi:hypothetical protein PVAP13_9NG706500 [Panicum virgatum]|uniref:Uncharacterized protein n=1 Tax=Panicum virgatum TaxID=38727 RepID=A0A8T0N1L8_PANVG|nr:hypothetical protein PVAP13_9NG706500 [Panicum virgatum]
MFPTLWPHFFSPAPDLTAPVPTVRAHTAGRPANHAVAKPARRAVYGDCVVAKPIRLMPPQLLQRRPPPLWLGEGPHGAGSERGGGHGAAAPRRLHLPAGPVRARRARPRGDGLLAAAAAGPRAWIRPTGGAPAGDKAGRRRARRHGDQQEQAVPAGMAARPRAARGRASSARSPRGRCRRPRGCWPSRHGVLRGRAARVLALRAPGGRAEVLPPGEWGWGQGRRRGGSCPGEDALTSRTRGRHFPAPSRSATRIK